MLIFLQYVGGFILAIIILLFVGYLYLKLKFGKLLGAHSDKSPLMVHLNEDLVIPEWLEKPQTVQIIADLEYLGFEKGKSYRVQEMEGVSLVSLYNKGYTSVVYNHPVVGVWTDIVLETEDEYHYTFSNAPMGGEIGFSEKDIKEYKPNATVEELFVFIREQTQDIKGVSVDNENFRIFFENAFKREASWKASQGGITREEFEKISENNNIKITIKNSEKAFIEAKQMELVEWNIYGIAEFIKNNNDDNFDGDTFIVPEKAYPCAFIEFLEVQDMIEEEQIEKLCERFKNESIGFIFETINATLSSELKAKKIGEITFPIKADVYQKKWIEY